MDPSDLRQRAQQEADELGPEPVELEERRLWREERRGAVELMAGLAGWDEARLRRAALDAAGELSHSEARRLLLDAAAIRRPA